MINCPACGSTCALTARHCPTCGLRLASTPAVSPYVATGATVATRAGPLPQGSLLNGRYHLVRVLGTGAFGRVYLAEDTHDPTSPPLAIKELLDAQFSSLQDKQEAISWFKREVSTLLTLDHSGIPAIHGYWTAHRTSGPFYLAMDYIPGKTLEDLLQVAGGRIHWRTVTHWGIALCEVLGYLHGRMPSFIFRDMKLPNVMIDERTGLPALIDFGITRQLASAGGTAIGTWGYVPYEQILGKAEPRSDLYALGATLHALLTGRHPDEEYTRLQRSGLDVESAIRALFPPVDTIVPGVPAELVRVLSQATAFASADRFPNADAMAAPLRQILGYAPKTIATGSATPPSVPAPTIRAAPPQVATPSITSYAPALGIGTWQMTTTLTLPITVDIHRIVAAWLQQRNAVLVGRTISPSLRMWMQKKYRSPRRPTAGRIVLWLIVGFAVAVVGMAIVASILDAIGGRLLSASGGAGLLYLSMLVVTPILYVLWRKRKGQSRIVRFDIATAPLATQNGVCQVYVSASEDSPDTRADLDVLLAMLGA